jgi:hypothetical protein
MPRLVADIHSGALAPQSALGYARIPGQLNGNCCQWLRPQLTLIATFGMNASTHKTERGRQNWPCALLFPSFEKGVVRSLAANQNAPWVKWRGRIFESDDSGFDFLAFYTPHSYPAIESLATDITSERFTISEHPPQSQIHKKLEPHIPRQPAVKRQPPSI